MNSGIYKILTLIIVLFSIVRPLHAQNASVDAVTQAMHSGDASGIARYFGNTIDITINNSQATYSKTQGELVLRDFFSKNSVKGFNIEHTGAASASNSVFTVGTLITTSGKYKVYLQLRKHDNTYMLTEVRLQR